MNIMRKVLTAVNEEIATLITEVPRYVRIIRKEFTTTSSIHRKLKTMETSIKKRHKRKLQRDHVNVVIAGKSQRKNIRFFEINLNEKNVKKGKEVSAVSKKEL